MKREFPSQGKDYIDFVLQSDLCMPAQKVESVMRQCLNSVFNKKLLFKKRTREDMSLTDYTDMEITDEARELMQVAATEFICFVTSDAIENVI